MKKSILAIAAILTASVGFSQDLMSKKGEAYLPEAGDYAVGFDAVPVLNVLKFNSNSDKIGAGYALPQFGILVKRFEDAKNAYRFGVQFGLNTANRKFEVDEYSNQSTDNGTVENEIRSTAFSLMLSLGKEMRRGNTRVQGYLGYEGMVRFGSDRTTIEYGNDFSDLPDENPYIGSDDAYGTDNTKYIEQDRSGLKFGIGARGFLGVEYFLAPKISINAEYGIGLMYNYTPRGEVDFTAVTGGSESSETVKGKSRASEFKLGTDITQGAVRLLFHF